MASGAALDDEDWVVETVDVFWFVNHDETYCQQQGMPTDERLYL